MVSAEGPWHSLTGKKRFPDTLGPILKEGGENIIEPHDGHGATAEIAHVLWERKGGEVRHRIRGLTFEMRPPENAPFEAVRQCGADAVRAQQRHA